MNIITLQEVTKKDKWKNYDPNKGFDTPSKGTVAGTFSWIGSKRNPHDAGFRKDSIPGYIIRGVDKVTRPIIHGVDYFNTGVDYIKDKIKGTSAGRAAANKANEYYYDPKGEHKVISTALQSGSSYAKNRAISHGLGLGNSGFWKVADAGVAAYKGYKQYKKSDERSKMNAKQLKNAISADRSRDYKERMERQERMNNFWKDMKF